jgi:hypothetical protein
MAETYMTKESGLTKLNSTRWKNPTSQVPKETADQRPIIVDEFEARRRVVSRFVDLRGLSEREPVGYASSSLGIGFTERVESHVAIGTSVRKKP